METKLKELANDRLSGFHVICQEAKEYIQLLNEEFVAELEAMGVSFHMAYNNKPQETTIKVAVQVADLLTGNPCDHS